MEYDFDKFRVERLVTGKWKENCYLLMDRESGELAIIDPGDDAETIASRLEATGGRVCHILLTHGHHDHVGAALELGRLTGLSCSIHRADVPLLRRAPLYAMAFEKRRLVIPDALSPFDGAQTFSLGGSLIEACPTPGHTPGSVCFKTGACLFAGDTLLNGKLGRTDLPGGDGKQLMRSVHSLMFRLTDDVLILPGHGQPWDQKKARAWWEATHSIEGAEAQGTS